MPTPLTALLLGTVGGGLALLGLVAPQDSPAPTALTANAAVAPAPLGPTSDDRSERASRSRRAAPPDPEPPPVRVEPTSVPAASKPAAPPLPGCVREAHDVDGYANGRLPESMLCVLPGGADERLRADAALAFARLAGAYQREVGEPICLTDGYRTLREQQQLRRTKPRLAARPGSSEHGWGLAVDLSCGVQSFRTRQHAWMTANAGAYGWFLPAWAQRGGTRPEPWHWEFSGS